MTFLKENCISITEMPLRSKGTQFGNYLSACWKSKPAFSQLTETFNFSFKSNLSAEDNKKIAVGS